MKKKYLVNGQYYEIPDHEHESFIKDFPDAKIVYNVGGQEYHIPHHEADAFETDMGLKEKKTPEQVGLPNSPERPKASSSFLDTYQDPELLKAQNKQEGVFTLPSGLTEEQDKQKSLLKLDQESERQKLQKEAEDNYQTQLKENGGQGTINLFKGLFDLGRKAISVFKDDIPASYYANQAINKKTDFIDELIRTHPEKYAVQNEFASDETRRKFAEEQAAKEFGDQLSLKKNEYEKQAIQEKIDFRRKAEEQQLEAQKFTGDQPGLKGIPQNWEEAKKQGSAGIASYIGGAMGNGLGQIPTSFVTGGGSSYLMEKSGAYDEAVAAIAKHEGISEDEVISKKLDQPAKEIAHVVGLVNGAIDLGSTGFTLSKAFGVGLKNIIKKKATEEILKEAPESLFKQGVKTASAPLVEYGTEFWQGTNSQIGALLASGKTEKEIAENILQGGDWIDWNKSREEGLQGLFGSMGIVTGGKLLSKNGNAGEAGKTTQKAGGEPVQRNEEQPKEQGSETPVQQSANEVGKTNTENVLEENSKLQGNGTETQGNQTGGLNTLSQGAEQKGSGSQQEDAEAITRGVQEASPSTPGAQRSTREIKKEQDLKLEANARKNGTFIEDVKQELGEKLDGGTEQDVYESKDGKNVIKVNGLSNHSGWSEFWDRLNLQKELFPETAYKLLGFTKEGGRLSAVTEQPYIHGTPVPRQELIDDLAKRGFFQIHPEKSLGENQFYNPELGVRLTDVHGENVIKDAEGNIRYIDPMLDRENPFVDEESKQHFNEQKINYEKINQNQNDSSNQSGLASEKREGQESQQTQPIESPSTQETGGSGMVQTPQEVEHLDKTEQEIRDISKQKGIELTDEEIGDIAAVHHGTEHELENAIDTYVANKEEIQKFQSQSTEANKEGVTQNQPTNGKVNEEGRQTRGQDVLTTQEEAVNEKQSPSEIARQYHEESRNPTHITEKEKAIAQALSNSKVHMESVKRFGDKNSIGQSMAKSYIRKKGVGLDQVAMSANEYLGSDSIEPGDVWEFMKRFPNGAQTPFTPSGNPKLAELANKYSGLTGKYINRKTAKSVMNKFERTAIESDEQRTEFEKRLSGYYDASTGEFNYKNAIEHFEKAPDLIKSAYGLTEQEFQNLKKKLYDEQEKNNAQKSIAPGEEGSQQNSGDDSGNASGEGQQSIRSQEELARSIEGKVRSLRSAETEGERQRIAQEIYDDTGQYILNREGVIVGSDASFADKTSDTFFDLIDEGKSVYLLDPDSKIAESEKDYQEIQDYINFVKGTETQLPLQDGKLMFDDAFANDVINAARELGFDGVRLLEIDGTNSTIQITNFNKLTHVAGEDFVASKKKANGAVSNESQRPAPTSEPTQNSPPEVIPPQPPNEGTTNQNSEGGENLSGIKKALAPEEVVDNTPVDERTDEQVLAQGKQDVESGKINPRALVESIRKQQRALQANEVAALVYYKAKLDNEVREATQAFLDSKDNQEQNLLDKARLDGLNMDLNDYYEMSVITARQQSMAFRLRKMLLDSEYNLQAQISKYKANNNGEITPDIQKKFEELDRQLKESNDRIAKLEGEQKQREEEYYFQRIKESEREARKKLLTIEKKKKITNFFDSLKVDTRNNTVNASVIPGLTLLPHVWNGSIEVIKQSVLAGSDVVEAIQEAIDYIKKNTKEPFDEKKYREGMEPLVQKIVPKPTPERKVSVTEKGLSIPDKLIKELVANGAENIEDLTQQIQDLIKADHPNVSIREIRDAITKYGKTASLSQDEIDIQVRHLKRMGRMLSQLEDIEKKQRPLRSGLQRDKLTDEERRLQKQVREGLKDLPIDSQEEEQAWKTALDKVKARLTNQIADLEDQIAKGEKTPKKKGIEYDEEALALQAKRDELRQILEDIEGKPELSDEQKIRMAVKSTEKAIEEYERRIKEKDFSKQKSTTPQTQELIELKAKRDLVKEQYKQLKEEEGVTARERLEARKKTVAKAIEEYERRIKEGDFSKKKVNAVSPDAELQKLKGEREKIKYEFDVAQEKNRLKNRSWGEKVADYVMDVISIPKSLESSIDLSAALRQGGYLLPSYPKQWGHAFTEMFRQAASKQKYEQWILDLKASDIWPIVQQSKLFIADNNAKLSAQEEQFASKLVRHIPLLGESFKLFGRNIPGMDLIGASNRAYAGFLNKLRLGVFAHGMDELQRNGFTIEKNEAEYKALADFVNNATGRGKLLKAGHFDVEAAAPVLNALFFSPRFMASRFNLLNPNYYRKMPPSVRKMALKSTGSYALFAVAIGLMAMGMGADWDKDPRSNDFLKIKVGDRRWNFLAGLNDYIRFMAILMSGQKTNNAGESYEMNRLEHLGRFTRSKLSPVAGSAVNLSLGADMVGQPATLESEARKLVTPLYIQEIAQTASKGDMANFITTAVPSIFGIGVQDYDSSGLSDVVPDVEQRNALVAAGAHINRPQFDQIYSIKGVKRKLTNDEYEKYVALSNEIITHEIGVAMLQMKDSGITNEEIIKRINYIVKTAREQARYQLFESEGAEVPDGYKEPLELRQ